MELNNGVIQPGKLSNDTPKPRPSSSSTNNKFDLSELKTIISEIMLTNSNIGASANDTDEATNLVKIKI